MNFRVYLGAFGTIALSSLQRDTAEKGEGRGGRQREREREKGREREKESESECKKAHKCFINDRRR